MVKVTVCIGSSCHLKGSRKVVEVLQNIVKERGLANDVDLAGTFCMGKCSENGVSVSVNNEYYAVDPDAVVDFFDSVVVSKLNEN